VTETKAKGAAKLQLNLILNTRRLKEAENAMKYELAKSKAIIEASQDCIKILDLKGNILYMNKGGLEEHGFKNPEQAIGWDWVASLEKPYRAKALNCLKKCLGGASVTVDVKHLPKYSKRKWCSITLAPIKVGGEVVRVLAISRDITLRKKMEEKLKARIRGD